jgi:DNA-nicking Smr family endonuclease
MTKKKRIEQQPVDFKNNPFKSLKGYASPAPAAPSSAKAVRKQEEHTGDEGELFLRATAGARKLHDAESPASPAIEGAGSKRPPPSLPVRDEELFTLAMRKIGAVVKNEVQNEEEFADDRDRRSRSSRMRQMTRGVIRISQEIDLHGYVRDEALTRLERFITNASDRGLDAVLVITGKGINSPEGPVLQGAVAAWLREKGKGMVAEFAPAPRDKGGSGAFVVFLKRK